MRKLASTLLVLSLSCLFCVSGYARHIMVGHGSGYDYQTITAAVRAAASGDVILVADGTYTQGNGEVFPILLGSGLTLKRATSGSLPVIEGNVHIDGGNNVRVEGFKITSSSGHGVWIENGNTVDINHCLITQHPKGIVCAGSAASFSNCSIERNGFAFPYFPSLAYGGGVHATANSHLVFRNCLINDNQAKSVGFGGAVSKGGGVYIDHAQVAFINCIIANNSASASALVDMWGRSYAWAHGGGVYVEDGGVTEFINCTFSNNTVDAHAVDTVTGGDHIYGPNTTTNCIIGHDGTYVDLAHGDYHLRDDSRFIDAGDEDPRWNDACMPPGKGTRRCDKGAYGGPNNCGWGEATLPPVCFNFDEGREGWGFLGNIMNFHEPFYEWEMGHLGLSPNGSANCFSYLFSPEIFVQKDKLYLIGWEVSSSVSNEDDALDFRLRANQLSNWRFWSTGVTSLNDAAPTTQSKTYVLVAVPETQSSVDTIVFCFDLMGFEPANDLLSWLYVDEVCVDEITTATTGKTLARYTFDTGNEGWQFQGKIINFNEPASVVEPGHIGLSPNGAVDGFSYWQSPAIQVEKDKVYHVNWKVSSSVSDPAKVVDFRLRCNQVSNLQAWDTGTFLSSSTAYPAGGQSREYTLFIFPQMTTLSDEIALSFDILSFDATDDLSSWIYLDEVEVEECAIQP